LQSYQLFINVTKEINLKVGKLGKFIFPVGSYVYTGSAKKKSIKELKGISLRKKISIGI
jgi:Uri superfamily endonuclease